MSLDPYVVLRSITDAAPHITDANNYAIWVHGIVKEALEQSEMTAEQEPVIAVDPVRLEVVSSLLYDFFSPFGADKDWQNVEIDAAFKQHIRKGAQAVLERLVDQWFPIDTAPDNGESVMLLNAVTGEQAVARMMSVKEQEPCWIFAQGFTAENSQISFRFNDPTHWKPISTDHPVWARPDEPTVDQVDEVVAAKPATDAPFEQAQPVEPIEP